MGAYLESMGTLGAPGDLGDARRAARLIAAASASFTAAIGVVALLLALTT